ncbi:MULTISPECIES: hypothetical protein [Halomarina]|uniref:Uncharacterized protein n=2 Tax=Halomarina TaxID=871740 RepID=A0A6B0GGQ6_9EURY|nr:MULTISPECIES: hypothetical protein [Halomarina]MWG33730.1 hypothetical protein [Halomarina oriensis]
MSGCVSLSGNAEQNRSQEETSNNSTEIVSCGDYAYQPKDTSDDDRLPWHVAIKNVDLESIPVSISIIEISDETEKEVISCLAKSKSHSKLIFDLSPNVGYRVDVTLERPTSSEKASTTVTGWNRVTGGNEALEATVEDGQFEIMHVHYDAGLTADNKS